MARVFFDTNVLVYCADPRDPLKQALARRAVAEASRTGQAVVSAQVLIELFNVLVRKLGAAPEIAARQVAAYQAWPVVESDLALVNDALAQSLRAGLSIFDAMIVAAAERAHAETLLSEDLNHSQRFGRVLVHNPFVAPA
jgi:predicted nucleic acid-binding protein